jgi:feruloyl esterase
MTNSGTQGEAPRHDQKSESATRLTRSVLFVVMAVMAWPATAQPSKPAMTCPDLIGFDLSPATGVSGKVDSAIVDKGKCHVKGTLRGTIGFEAWLPMETWTGRYLQMGCGGLCGRISTSAPQTKGCSTLERDAFVTAATDMGTRGPPSAWGGDPERRVDFAHRAQHLTARATKALIARFYGRTPTKSYFSGCSDGGREGIIAAQLYPQDFDGIVAGAPVVDFTAQNTFHHAWTVQKNRKADGTAALTANRLPVLVSLVKTACGDAEGVIADPLVCPFDPKKHVCAANADQSTCLTAEEASFAAAIYDGPRTIDGHRVTAGGLLPGSEANWRGVLVPDDATTPPRAKMFAGGVLANLAFKPGSRTPTPEALAYDAAMIDQVADSRRTYDATQTGLDRFFARGGRLLVWHGLADQDISPRTTLAWWAALRRDLGDQRVDQFARLFLIPGLAHCRGGIGSNTEFDSLSPLLDWVEAGVAPETLAIGIKPTRTTTVPSFLGAERFGRRN